jgi:sporulation protein YlmC with PRC-barrel domain
MTVSAVLGMLGWSFRNQALLNGSWQENIMIDLPTKAEVHCSDGAAGRFTYVIGNPINREITHLVVKSYLPPFHEYLVPVDQVEETTDDRIKLKCTRDELNKMEPFEYKEYRRAEMPGYLYWTHVQPAVVDMTEEVEFYMPVKRQNVPAGEFALQRDARVEATDGYVGQVDELLINSNTKQVTHLVLLERHIFQKREITIPVSQIDHIAEGTIYLNLDRQSVEELPITPIQRWTRSVSKSSA